MAKRAFTIIEVMLVLVMGTILTTAGIVGATNIIKEARYRADRTRLFQDVRKARDIGNASKTAIMILEVPSAANNSVSFQLMTDCTGIPALVKDLGTKVYPTIDHAGDRGFCNNRFNTPPKGTNLFGPVRLDFLEAGGGPAPADEIFAKTDGTMFENWGEFPNEGALEGSECDVDDFTPCGD